MVAPITGASVHVAPSISAKRASGTALARPMPPLMLGASHATNRISAMFEVPSTSASHHGSPNIALAAMPATSMPASIQARSRGGWCSVTPAPKAVASQTMAALPG